MSSPIKPGLRLLRCCRRSGGLAASGLSTGVPGCTLRCSMATGRPAATWSRGGDPGPARGWGRRPGRPRGCGPAVRAERCRAGSAGPAPSAPRSMPISTGWPGSSLEAGIGPLYPARRTPGPVDGLRQAVAAVARARPRCSPDLPPRRQPSRADPPLRRCPRSAPAWPGAICAGRGARRSGRASTAAPEGTHVRVGLTRVSSPTQGRARSAPGSGRRGHRRRTH